VVNVRDSCLGVRWTRSKSSDDHATKENFKSKQTDIIHNSYLLSTGLIKKLSGGEYGTKRKSKEFDSSLFYLRLQNGSLELNKLWSIDAAPSARRGCLTATPISFLNKNLCFLLFFYKINIQLTLPVPKPMAKHFPYLFLMVVYVTCQTSLLTFFFFLILNFNWNISNNKGNKTTRKNITIYIYIYTQISRRCCSYNDTDEKQIHFSLLFIYLYRQKNIIEGLTSTTLQLY